MRVMAGCVTAHCQAGWSWELRRSKVCSERRGVQLGVPGVTGPQSVRPESLLTADMESDNLQSSPPPPPHQDIVKEGWLMKRGEVIKNWRPR